MAIPEACALWIEQQIDDELKEKEVTEKSLRAIGRDIATEIERVFKAKVKPETIRKKAERMAIGTNVPSSQNTPPTPEKKEETLPVLCRKCRKNKAETRKGVVYKHGMCRRCRDEERALKTIESSAPTVTKLILPEHDADQIIAWNHVIDKIEYITKYLSSHVEFPPELPQDKIAEIDDAIKTLNTFFDFLEG